MPMSDESAMVPHQTIEISIELGMPVLHKMRLATGETKLRFSEMLGY